MQGTATKRKHAAEREDIFFYRTMKPFPPNNGAILTNATIIKAVMSSAAEAELGALYLNAKEAIYLRQILKGMDIPNQRLRFRPTTRPWWE